MNIEKIEKLVIPILEAEGFELVDIEYKKEASRHLLRIYIDSEKCVTLDNCQSMSNQIGAILDVEDTDTIHPAYTLEVSSPGVERPLKKIENYKRFFGRKIKIRLYKRLDGKRDFEGYIDSVEKDTIIIKEEETDKKNKIIYKDVAKANLVFEFR